MQDTSGTTPFESLKRLLLRTLVAISFTAVVVGGSLFATPHDTLTALAMVPFINVAVFIVVPVLILRVGWTIGSRIVSRRSGRSP
jgi:hypothetical protein